MKFLSQINVNTEYTLPMVDGTNGQVLSTDGNGVAYWGTISAGSLTLDGLSDVIITSPSTGQILRYGIPVGSDEGNPVWHNVTPNYLTTSSSIDALNDVTITTAATGQLLRYNGSAWVNWTPNFLTSLPAHTHNDIYYTEEEIDSLFAGETEIDGYNRGAWDVAYNDKINSASFSTTTGVLTLTQQDTGTVTVDLDGRYLESYTETDTLSSVTGRGNTTTNRIGVTTASPINFFTAGNLGTWLGGIQDSNNGWSISNNGLGLKADNTTYSAIVMGPANGLIYFGRTLAGVGTMATWLEVNNSGTANFKLTRPQHNGSNLALVSEIPTDLNQLTNTPGYITGISFANVSSKPTTIAGYGITDAITTTNIGNQSVAFATVSRRVIDTPSARITTPEGAYSVNNSSGTGGAIRIQLPTTVYNNNTMVSMTVEVYLYSTGQSFTLRIGGYNYFDGSWYNVFASLLSDSGKSLNVPVYFGNNGVDRNVIWIGDSNSSWEYPNVFVTDVQVGHSQSESWAKGWSVSFSEAEQTNVTASRIAYRQIDAGNIGSYALTSLPAHNHDDRYYTETESDSRFYLATNPNGYITSSGNTSGYSASLSSDDNRTISPSEAGASQLRFGFTSWTNNNASPWADYLHLRSYSDSSGGSDNLVMFKKTGGIGMRIWQQTWGSATAYSSYVDVWTTGNFSSTDVSNWNEAYGWGDHAEAGYLTDFSYTETDTLSSVTGRGGSTGSPVVMYGKVTLGNNSSGTYSGNTTGLTLNSTAEVRSTSIQNPPALTWHYEGLATRHLLMTSAGAMNFVSPSNEASGVAVLQVNGNTVWHAGNLNPSGFVATSGAEFTGPVIVNVGDVAVDTMAFKVAGPSDYDSLTIGMRGTPDYDSYIASYGNDIHFYSGKGVTTENHSFFWYTSKSGSQQHGVVAMKLDHLQNLTIGGTYTENSSIRYKDNITPLESVSGKVEKLEAVTYTKKGDELVQLGLIAESVSELFPEIVKYDEEGRPDGVSYTRLSVILLKAVQELTERVNKLENK